MPADFWEVCAEFAALFSMQPSEIDGLSPADFMHWVRQADRINAEIETAKANAGGS